MKSFIKKLLFLVDMFESSFKYQRHRVEKKRDIEDRIRHCENLPCHRQCLKMTCPDGCSYHHCIVERIEVWPTLCSFKPMDEKCSNEPTHKKDNDNYLELTMGVEVEKCWHEIPIMSKILWWDFIVKIWKINGKTKTHPRGGELFTKTWRKLHSIWRVGIHYTCRWNRTESFHSIVDRLGKIKDMELYDTSSSETDNAKYWWWKRSKLNPKRKVILIVNSVCTEDLDSSSKSLFHKVNRETWGM